MRYILYSLFGAFVIFCLAPVSAIATPVKLGKPHIYLAQNGCDDHLTITASDSTPDDQGLSDVEILWDSLGVIGPPLVSYNVGYDGSEPDQSQYTYEMVTTFGVK